jgi:hypothetical protein
MVKLTWMLLWFVVGSYWFVTQYVEPARTLLKLKSKYQHLENRNCMFKQISAGEGP